MDICPAFNFINAKKATLIFVWNSSIQVIKQGQYLLPQLPLLLHPLLLGPKLVSDILIVKAYSQYAQCTYNQPMRSDLAPYWLCAANEEPGQFFCIDD